jgi:hypothetical protein
VAIIPGSLDLAVGPLRLLSDLAVERDPASPVKLFYLSFADGSLPSGSQFLGGLFFRAKTVAGALAGSRRLGLNPGGSVLAVEVPPGSPVDESLVGRLLSRAEVGAL